MSTLLAEPGWIGVDLDGTLAKYDGWRGPTHIGEPVGPMLFRVRKWLADGRTVRIFTARASCQEPERAIVVDAINAWCREHLGQTLPVTHAKDFLMVQLWDDRCIQVEPNTGRRVDGRSE